MQLLLLAVMYVGALLNPAPDARTPAFCFPVRFDYASDLETLAPLDSLTLGFDTFFSGEAHRIAGNEERHFKLFTYLHRQARVRYYVKEGSYSYTYFVNKYVQTGQQQWLDTALVTLRQTSTDVATNRELSLWQHLHRFNVALPANQQIQVVGIDTDPFWSMAVLRDLIRVHGQPPAPLRPAVDQLLPLQAAYPLNVMQLHRRDRARLQPVLQRVQQLTRTHQALLCQWLGADSRHWEMLIDNPAAFRRTEPNLAANFIRLRQQLPAAGYFLQYGRLHAQLHKKNFGQPWLAGLLARRYKVLSFQPYYLNCQAAWGQASYQDTRWLSRSLAQLLEQATANNSHSLVLPAASGNSLQTLNRYGQVFIVERNLSF